MLSVDVAGVTGGGESVDDVESLKTTGELLIYLQINFR